MSYRTTAILLVLLAALGSYMYFFGAGSKNEQNTDDGNLQVLDFEEKSVESLELREAGSVVLLRRNAGGQWQLVRPEQAEGDQSRVESVIYTIAKLQATKVVATGATDLAEYGLSRPEIEVVLGSTGGDSVQLLVGGRNPANSGYYVKRAGIDSIYLVPSYTVSQLRNLISEPPKAKPPATNTVAPVPTPSP